MKDVAADAPSSNGSPLSAPPARRASDRLLALFGVRLTLWFFVVALLLPGVLEAPHALTAHYDDHYFFAHEEAARISLLRYHQLPAWNPYYCGGIPLAANPQDETFAPDFLLRLAFGTGPGRHLAVVLFVLLGLEGTHRLARRYGASQVAAAAAAIAFACSGRFFVMLEYGWVHMFGFQLLPFAVLAYEKALASWRWAIAGGAMLAWMLLCGGTYTVPYSAVALAALALHDAARAFLAPAERRWWRPLAVVAAMGGVAAVLGGVKLLPMIRIILEHPRMVDAPDGYRISAVIEMLTARKRDLGTMAGESFIGEGMIILALFAPIVRSRAGGRMLFAAIVFFGLSMGQVGSAALFPLLRKLPIYEQLRNPERFTVIVALFFALAASQSLTWLEDLPARVGRVVRDRYRAFRARRRGEVAVVGEAAPPLGVVARFVLGLVGAAIVVAVAYPMARLVLRHNVVVPGFYAQEAPLARQAPFRQARGNRWEAHVWPPASLGTLQCFEETEFPQSARLRGDLPAEEYGATPDVKVERIAWSPNAITLRVASPGPATVLVNQNYDRGWRSGQGRVRSEEGLLAVDVPAGETTVQLVYRDWLLTIGLLLTVVGWSALGWVAYDGWKRARVEHAAGRGA